MTREAAGLLHGYTLPGTLSCASRARHVLKLLQPVLQVIERLPQYRELLLQQRQALGWLFNPAGCGDRDGEADRGDGTEDCDNQQESRECSGQPQPLV